MGDANRFAFGIAILLGAMIFFFFAFHPNGVDLESQNPVGILKWLMDEFNAAGTASQGNTAAATGPQNVGAAPTPTEA